MRPVVVILLALTALQSASAASNHAKPAPRRQDRTAQAVLGRLPLSFEPNLGQASAGAAFLAHLGGLQVDLASDRLSLTLPPGGRGQKLTMTLPGADPRASSQASDQGPGQTNYLLGNDSRSWRHVPEYGRVTFNAVYPGIDLAFYGNGSKLEHDFIVHPGANPALIRMDYQGARRLTLDEAGDLHIKLSQGELISHAPLVYQLRNGAREYRSSRYVLHGKHEVGFVVTSADPNLPLIIDPVLDYATYLAVLSLSVDGVATDSVGNTYIVGETFSANYPVTSGAAQPTCSSCPNTGDIFVTKLNAAGTAQLYSTFIGGNNNDQPAAIAVDSNGNAAITGSTASPDFPLKNPIASGVATTTDGFITSLSPDGSALNFSSRLGGSSSSGYAVMTYPQSVTADANGNVYVSGTTESPYLPVTAGALNAGTPAYSNPYVFLLKLQLSGQLSFGALLGAPGQASGSVGTSGLAVDSAGDIYMAGTAGETVFTTATPWPVTSGAYQTSLISPSQSAPFVAEIAGDGSRFLYSTLVGSGNASAMTVNSNGEVLIAGSPGYNFPITADAYSSTASSAFLAKLNADGSQLLYATYLGNTINAFNPINGLALDTSGDLWLSGLSVGGLNLVDPIVSNPGPGDTTTSFVEEFDPTLRTPLFSTYLNGPSGGTHVAGLALDPQNRVHLAGTANDDFPTTSGALLPTVTPPPPTYTYTYGFAAVIDPAAPSPALCTANNSGAVAQIGTTGQGSFTVTNCGTAPLLIGTLQLQSPGFTLTTPSACLTTLAPGATCSVSFSFTPAAAGTVTATVVISSNAAVASDSVTVSGTGTAPTLYLLADSIEFSTQVLGIPGTDALFVVLNQGTAPLSIDLTRTIVSGPFSIVSTTCKTPLPPGGFGVASSCQFVLSYTPTAVGTDTGALTIYSDDPQHPQIAVPLSGTTVAAYTTPSVTQLSPSAVPLNATTTLYVIGTNFFPGSYVTLDGEPLPTTFNGSSALQVTLDPALLSVVGELPLVVVNPSPGGASNSTPLTIYRSVPLSASSLVYDPVGNLLYAAIPSTAASNPNTVISIDPLTGNLGTPIPVGNNPAELALSGDSSYLFVGLNNDHTLQRINIATQQVDRTFPLPPDALTGSTTVDEMHVVPGSPQNIVVSLGRNGSPSEAGAALYTDAGLAAFLPNDPEHTVYSLDSFTFTSDPSTIYGYPFAGAFFNTTAVGSTTLSIINNGQFGGCCNETTGSIVTSDGTLLYTNSGEVWNPKTQTLLGTFLAPSGNPLFYEASVVASAADARAYILDASSIAGISADTILGYSPSTYKQTGELIIPGNNYPDAIDLARWGADGFAFRFYDYTNTNHANDAIVLIRSSLAHTATGGTPTLTTLSPSSAASGSANVTLTIDGAGFIPGSVVLWNGSARQTTFNSPTQLSSLIPSSDLAIAGSAQITVANPGGSTSSALRFTITGTAPTITLAIPDQVLGAAPFGITATSNSTGTLSYSVLTGPATIAGSTVTLTGAGTVVIQVNQAAAAGFSAGQAVATFNVTQAVSQIAWPTPPSLTYGTALSAAQLNATAPVPGTFTYTPAAGAILPAGSQTLSVTFTPASATGSTATATTTLIVAQAPLTVSAGNATRSYGSPNPALTATIAGAVNGDILSATATTSAATLSAVGTYTIIPSVGGANIGDYSVTPVNGTLTVTQAATAATLTSSAASSPTGANLTFTAAVTSTTSGTPTGAVQFIENGSTVLGTAQLNGGGVASFSTAALAAGAQAITAVYGGDTNFKGSQSSTLSQTVVIPDFSVTATPSTLSIQRGQTGTAVFTVTPINGFNQPVTLSCGTLPASVTCTFAPPSVTTNGAPVSSTLTITTTAPAVSALHPATRRSLFRPEAKSVLAFAAACCFLPFAGWRRARRSLRYLGLLALLALPLISGCGASSPQTTSPIAGTPLGTSQVIVMVSTAAGAAGNQHTANLTITITD